MKQGKERALHRILLNDVIYSLSVSMCLSDKIKIIPFIIKSFISFLSLLSQIFFAMSQ